MSVEESLIHFNFFACPFLYQLLQRTVSKNDITMLTLKHLHVLFWQLKAVELTVRNKAGCIL